MKENKTGIQLIADERKRQIEVEGFTEEHDLENHTISQMMAAADCYLNSERFKTNPLMSMYWPFDRAWFKPKNTIKDLIKAGAFIAAAIDLYKNKYPEKFEEYLND